MHRKCAVQYGRLQKENGIGIISNQYCYFLVPGILHPSVLTLVGSVTLLNLTQHSSYGRREGSTLNWDYGDGQF